MDRTLNDIVCKALEGFNDQDRIMPGWVANAAYQLIDANNISPALVKIAALQALKQIAREVLRGKFEPDDDDNAAQHELWPDLQQRYPVARQRGDEPVYVKPELMTEDDVAWNVNRLRKEGETKLKRARALEQWWEDRQRLQEKLSQGN